MATIERKSVVAGSAIELARGSDSDQNSSTALLKNTGANPVYVGTDSGVTSSTGFRLDIADGIVPVVLDKDEALYARCAAAESATVHVIVS